MREPPRAGTEVAGYRLERPLGRGGMAVVFAAHDPRLDRRVALKLLPPEYAIDEAFRERFLRESRAVAGIDHPNVIPLFDAGEADGQLYIAMRLVEGRDLARVLHETGPLPIGRAIAIVAQIAAGLEAAHRRGLVHRDIKPANVLLTGDDHVYLSDFGLAKLADSVSGLTATGEFMGTVSYIAPEQAEGRPVDARTDIYALGCVLFCCLAGRPPFKKDEQLATVMAHVSEPPPAVTDLRPDCPPALAGVVARALAKSPADRQQDCGELIEQLRAADAGPVDVTRSEPVPVTRRPVRRGGLLIGAAAAALLAALVIGLTTGGGGGEPTAAPQTRIGKPPPTDSHWRTLRPDPIARVQAAGAIGGQRIWIFGGLTGHKVGSTSATNKVEVYDPAIDTWATGPDLPVPLHHAMAVSYRGEHVVIGGWSPRGSDLTGATSDRVYVMTEDHWKELPPLRRPRAAGAAAVVGDRIVVVGGQAGDKLVTATEVFDGKRWRDGAPIPTPREHLAAASDGSAVYAVGGRVLTADRNSDALERYDPDTDTWTRLPALPTPAGSLGAAIVGHTLVAIGGETSTKVLGAVQAFDLRKQTWSALPPLHTPRHGLVAVGLANTILTLTGASSPTLAESSAVVEALDFASAH
jgi:non-specific serine/threonine protein kinase